MKQDIAFLISGLKMIEDGHQTKYYDFYRSYFLCFGTHICQEACHFPGTVRVRLRLCKEREWSWLGLV